ncbi:MAG: 6-carboxytetrahydropterin synthase [Bacteroidales bacterium]|nr:6-carboxytetrahydropterin synthase [Bacteroidales bacterium]MBN2762595.1 6-carboxytetrahydropterin synthase [Bacteroidales bacterium]
MKATACRKMHFNAAHRLMNPNWDEKHNTDIFGVCSNPNYHGHNYDLIVKVTGDIDPETGFVYDMVKLKQITDDYVISKFDHKNLNLEVEEFRNLNPTAENIAMVIWNVLRDKIDNRFSLSVVLFETERNFVEYNGN